MLIASAWPILSELVNQIHFGVFSSVNYCMIMSKIIKLFVIILSTLQVLCTPLLFIAFGCCLGRSILSIVQGHSNDIGIIIPIRQGRWNKQHKTKHTWTLYSNRCIEYSPIEIWNISHHWCICFTRIYVIGGDVLSDLEGDMVNEIDVQQYT